MPLPLQLGVFETKDDLYHYSKTKKTIIKGNTKKIWIQLPDEMGGNKLNVIREDIKECEFCNRQHITKCYVLQNNYSVYKCIGGWGWLQN